MATPKKCGTPYQEALLGLCRQVRRIYREEVEQDLRIEVSRIQGDTLICVSVQFQGSGREAWVPLEIGPEGWSEQRRLRIVHEATHVVGKLLDTEKMVGIFVSSRIQEVINGFR